MDKKIRTLEERIKKNEKDLRRLGGFGLISLGIVLALIIFF